MTTVSKRSLSSPRKHTRAGDRLSSLYPEHHTIHRAYGYGPKRCLATSSRTREWSLLTGLAHEPVGVVPRMRGWSQLVLGGLGEVAVVPARAGVVPGWVPQ